MIMALLLLGGSSIAIPPVVEAQSAASLLSSTRPLPLLLDPALQALQRHKAPAATASTTQGREGEVWGGLRGAAGSAAADAGVKRAGPSTGKGKGKAGTREENATASSSAAMAKEDPLAALTPTQFLRLDFPIPKSLRAREALRLEGDEPVSSTRPARPQGAVAGGRRNQSVGAQGHQHYEIVVDRYEDGPHGACKPSSSLGGAEEKQEPVDKKGKTGSSLPQVTCNLRAALRWATERHRRVPQGVETIVTVYLPTRWPHLVTLGELAVAEKGCVDYNRLIDVAGELDL